VAGRSKPMQCLTISNQLGNELNGRFAGDEVVGTRVVCKSDKKEVKDEGLFTDNAYVVEGIGIAAWGRPVVHRIRRPECSSDGMSRDGALGPGGDRLDDYCIFQIDEHYRYSTWFFSTPSICPRSGFVGPSPFALQFLNRKIKSKLLGFARTDKSTSARCLIPHQ
jgi:hypothetical protein